MDTTLKHQIGQMLIAGFPSQEVDCQARRLAEEWQVGNFILFARNMQTAGQTARLCAGLSALAFEKTGLSPFIAADQEGGLVCRITEGAALFPGAMALAAGSGPDRARQVGENCGRMLRAMGVNVNFAPVLDVNSNASNPVIGVRSFGDNPEAVAAFGCASLAPYRGSGVLCCAKHFPGHGDTAVDSHLGLPRVDKTEQELEALELIPFRRAIAQGVPAIMMSHVLFPALEPDGLPCTMSRRMVTGLLREKLGFQGLILTDCMEMLAIQDHFGTANGVVASIQAGVDLAELSATFDLEQASAQALLEACEAGKLNLDEIQESVARILRYKQQLFPETAPALCDLPEDRAVAETLARDAVTEIRGRRFPVNEKTFFCGCADYRASGVGNETGAAATFPGYLGRHFGGKHLVTPKDPTEADIQGALAAAQDCDTVVLGTCNAHLFRVQLALANALAALGKPMAVAAMRNPYDLTALPEGLWLLAAYDYSEPALAALAQVLGGSAAKGRCPVRL